MRKKLLLLILTMCFMVTGANADVNDLIASLNALEDHITDVDPLDAAEIAAHKATIDSNKLLMGDNATVIQASIDLVEAFDTTQGFGPLWINVHPPSRDAFTEDLVSTMYWVQQYIMDETYTVANVSTHEAILDGFKFDCSAVFPGSVAPPTIVTHTATIDASYPDTLGWLRQGDDLPARKPTGTYLSPGTIATVTVPSELVNSGYQIRVGAHSWDHSYRTPNKRLERSTVVYDITGTQTKVANPLGGGIYIEVPYESANGIVTVDVTGGVRSPYFSAKSFDTTTLSEWQNTERNHPAPWADFQTEKYMTQVPTNYIYAFDDPVTGMANWDASIDVFNDLMGFPRDRGKETIYTQNDVIMRSSVHAPGYPSVNTTDSDPTSGSNGDTGSCLVNGPGTDLYIASIEIHEQGHAYFFDKFAGEMESTVNLPQVAILNQVFENDLDFSLAGSFNFQSNPHRTLDNAALTWMTVFNFSPREVAMASAEASYQLKGHAKFADIARLFGWQVLNDYWHQMVLEGINKNNSPFSDDDRILRLSIAAGVDLRPLLHFWGKPPLDPSALEAAIAAENLQPSTDIYNALVHYKSLIPANNAAFQTYVLNWWGRQPSVNAAWTEVEHARQMNTTSYWQDRGWDYMGTDINFADGEVYNEDTCARTKGLMDRIISLYFPVNEYDSPTPDPMTFATAPFASGDDSISMVATVATDSSGVEYYFTCTAGGGNDSGWQVSRNYTDTGLALDTQFTYTVTARDMSPNQNTTAASAGASASTAPDTDPPTPDPVTWEYVPTVGGASGSPESVLGILTAGVLSGNNPATGAAWATGDHYRLAFFTSATTAATSSDISTYNTWMQGLADATTAYDIGAAEGVTWKAIGSTATVDAIDNTSTDPVADGTGNAIYLLDGSTVAANNNSDLWDGSLQHIIDITEQGAVYTWWPWTGTNLYGTADTPLGGSSVGQGNSSLTYQWIWRANTNDPSSYTHNMYALSEPLLVMATGDTDTSISMVANTATDLSGIEYFFDETSGNPGGTDSDWQDSPLYIDTGLSAGTQYSYTITARDKSSNQNETTPSAPLSATTTGSASDTDPPTPNPATFASAPAADSDTAISMTATTGSDATAPVEYLFTETSGNPGATSSAWQTNTLYTDSGLDADTQYTYTVTMRDGLENTGTASSPASATTDPAPSGDTVNITKAEYKANKSEINVEATSSDGSSVTLTLVGYGTMTYDARKILFKYKVASVPDPGATVTVTSSGGGSDTANVLHK